MPASSTLDRILDAAEACYDRSGIERATVDAIATTAGVARITVYRQVGGRDQVIRATLLRVTARFLAAARPTLLRADNLGAALVALIVSTVNAARRNDLRLLYASEFHRVEGNPIPGTASDLFALFADTVQLLVDELPGELADGVDVVTAGEWVLRTVLSLLSVSSTLPPDQLADILDRVVVAGLIGSDNGRRRHQLPDR